MQAHELQSHEAPRVAAGDPVREAAENMKRVLLANDEDPSLAHRDVEDALSPLRGQFGQLFGNSLARPAREPGRQASIVYFDPALMIQIVNEPGGFRLPVHNHAAWNVLYVCEGEMQFRWYKRRDDRSCPGLASLEIADDRVLHGGDAGIVGRPPHDIHELEIVSDEIWMVVVTPEPEVTTREIYDVARGTYTLKTLHPVAPQLFQKSRAEVIG